MGSKLSLENEEVETDPRFKYDPEGKNRMFSLISYVIVILVIGLPMWWLTTRVYRAPLPLDEMLSFDIPKKTIRENSIPLSLEYDVLITVLNPDPSNLDVDIQMVDLKLSLEGFLKQIGPIANFTVKSQWLYLLELGVQPIEDKGRFFIEEDQLPLIITPLEKKMWSHMSPRPTLKLVTYISRCDKPIFIRDKKRNIVESNAFLNPRWGGIGIINPDKESCLKKSFKPDISLILSTYSNHLQNLLGLKENDPESVKSLMKIKTLDMIKSTKRTLKSLALLLSEINSIVISDEVALKVNTALENAQKAERFMEKGDVENGLAAAKVAYWFSEGAFSDPSLLALLYFPDDQKYAVYIPLFLPVMLPVLISLVNLKKWIDKQKKLKTEKLE
nr:GPI transamidase component PIG-S [Onthophagus taurus]